MLAHQVLVGAWAAFVATVLFRRPPTGSEIRRDPRSQLGVFVQSLGFAAVWALRRPLGSLLIPGPLGLALDTAGVALAVGSVGLAWWASRSLGKQWAVPARLIEGHELVTDGPYRWIRNPIYAAMSGMLLATGLVESLAWAIPLGLLPFAIGTAIRVRSEEGLLRDAFGARFDAWAARVPALIPGVW